MERHEVLCDACGDTPAKKVSCHYGRSYDGCGGYDDDYENIDLCVHCCAVFLSNVLEKKGIVPIADRLYVQKQFQKLKESKKKEQLR